MDWIPAGMWLTHLAINSTAGDLTYDLAMDVSGRGRPSRVAAGLDLPRSSRTPTPIDHEFILGKEAVQRRHETGTEPAHGAVPGEVSAPAGETAETTYTFSEPGVLLIGCHASGHYAYGMRGWVRVVPP